MPSPRRHPWIPRSPRLRSLLLITLVSVAVATAGGARAASDASLGTRSAAVTAAAGASGVVAAYSFDAGSGTTLPDASGSANDGTISGATWASAGKSGGALSFDGVNDIVTIADAASLDLSSGMTLEAWVKPESSDWRTVVLKERPGGVAYALYASTDTNRPSGEIWTSSTGETRGSATLPSLAWSHLATTYDGATLRLYVNGTQVSSLARSGSIAVTGNALRIGGNAVWGEYFKGSIDDVRVYNRALSASELQTDMNTPVGGSAPADQ